MEHAKRFTKPLAFALVAAFAAVLVAVAAFPADAARHRWQPPPDTITRVEGDKANGFTVHYFDGTSISPPTDSEARAECSEYDTRVQRVRCRTEVRVWYAALGDTQQALRLAWRSRH